MKYSRNSKVVVAFLGILVLQPLTGLFWQIHWGWIKANWIPYPLLLLSLLATVVSTRRAPRVALAGLGVLGVYAIIFSYKGGEWESLLRLGVALLPLFFIEVLRDSVSADLFVKFWKVYLAILLIPIALSVFQLLGYVPYYDPGMAYDLYKGRISGGYMKPNNLNALLFPGYLYGFYLIDRGKKWKGVAIAAGILVVVLISGLRTSVIAYLVVLLLSFIPRLTTAAIYRGFRYGIFIAIGIGSFYFLSGFREQFGLQYALRYRLPMWTIHAEYFFHSSATEILFGKGEVLLPGEASRFKLDSLSEAHNNEFRILITFGLTGYLLYGLLLRAIATTVYESAISDRLKFLQFACLVHVLIYSITNEPAFYPGVFWPLIAWIIFMPDPEKGSLKT